MLKISLLWRLMVVLPAIALASLSVGKSAFANPSASESTTTTLTIAGSPTTMPTTIDQVEQLTQVQPVPQLADVPQQNTEASGLDVVTSVSQLGDVQPTDWAFQALQSLVERYGCIAGYPDGTYKGSRALSRYEFAAGLNACMDRVNELIAAGTADLVTKSDLATLQALQDQFKAELETLRGRVDTLTGRVDTLESQQFSTTTKLNGLAFFNITGVGGVGSGNPLIREGESVGGLGIIGDLLGTATPNSATTTNPNLTFSNLVWLTLQTSFTGKDLLITQLAVGNGTSPANLLVSAGGFNTWGTPFTDQTAGDQFAPTLGTFVLRELSYLFPVGDNLKVVVGPRVNVYRFFDDNRFTFILNGGGFSSTGSTLFNGIDRGAGAAALFDLGKQFSFRVGYFGLANEFLPSFLTTASLPTRGNGLFDGINTLVGELGFSSTDKNFNLRLTYARTSQNAQGNFVAATEPTTGVYDFRSGAGTSTNVSSDTFLANFDWLLTPGIGLFGRYGYATSTLYKTSGSIGSVNTQSVQAGLGFPDLGKKGALGTLSFLIPFDVTSGRNLLASGAAFNSGRAYATQYELEANYYFPVTDNIALVPHLQVIFNPNNISGNPTVYVYNLRTQFSF